MNQQPQVVSIRDAEAIIKKLLVRRLGYVPDWQPGDDGIDQALIQVFARYLQTLIDRLNQAPEKNKLAFFDLLGLSLIPAQPARVPLVFEPSIKADLAEETYRNLQSVLGSLKESLSQDFIDSLGAQFESSKRAYEQAFGGSVTGRIPQGMRVAASNPLNKNVQVVFETEQPIGIAATQLTHIVSVLPDQDQYIDHSKGFRTGEGFCPFQELSSEKLPDSKHYLYLAHDTLLALAGTCSLEVQLTLKNTANTHLKIDWEFWNGIDWQLFVISTLPTNNSTQSTKLKLTFPELENAPRGPVKNIKLMVGGIEDQSFWIRGSLHDRLISGYILPEILNISIRLSLIKNNGLKLDNAFSDNTEIDLSKAFYPFGQSPIPGSAFYLNQEEVFSKPGATVSISISRVQDNVQQTYVQLDPAAAVVWEYWNGFEWEELEYIWTGITMTGAIGESIMCTEVKPDLNTSMMFSFNVPKICQRVINGKSGRWIRVILESGGFEIKVTSTPVEYVLSKPPVLAYFRMDYSLTDSKPEDPKQVLTCNDFKWEKHAGPGKSLTPFQPFRAIEDASETLYLGFTSPFPSDRVGLYFDIIESRDAWQDSPVIWEYWNGQWQELTVDDETLNLHIPGMLSFIGPADSKPIARFGEDRHWLRIRFSSEATKNLPKIRKIYLNSVWGTQRSTCRDVSLGSSTGVPGQVFQIHQTPVLDGERLEVCELSGPRAAVEWPMVAKGFQQEQPNLIADIQNLLNSESVPAEIVKGDFRLQVGRGGKVNEVWVRWCEQPHLLLSKPSDRHYSLDRARGLLFFGDGNRGRVPPKGTKILARQFDTGGGAAGNVAAGTVSQLLGAIPNVQGVVNPKAAEGGSNSESLAGFSRRASNTLRHRGRAIMSGDYEAMAYEASSTVALATILPNSKRGLVNLLIIPQSQEARPQPSFGLRERVRKYIEARAPADIAAGHCISVVGPNYCQVDVEATIATKATVDVAKVKAEARGAMEAFLHPLRGGPERSGWDRGRDVFLSDVAVLLEGINGIDYVDSMILSVSDTLLQLIPGLPSQPPLFNLAPSGKSLTSTKRLSVVNWSVSDAGRKLLPLIQVNNNVWVPDDQIVSAGKIKLILKQAPR